MKAALITGASSGIGKELTKIMAAHGHNIVIVARSKDDLVKLKKDLEHTFHVKIVAVAMDLTMPDAHTKLKAALQKQDISINILVNNAGVGLYGEFAKTDLEKEKKMIELNIIALTSLTKVFLPDVRKNKGRIMNVASLASFFPGPYMAVYFATKHYVLAFSEALSEEESDEVRVTALCPGPTKSGFWKAANASSNPVVNPNIPTSREVAEFGYAAMMKGKRVAVHGMKNSLLLQLKRVLPRNMQTRFVGNSQRKN